MDRGAFREFQVTGKGLEVLGEFGHVEVVGVVVVDAKAATDIDITQHRRRSTCNTSSGTSNTSTSNSTGTCNTRSGTSNSTGTRNTRSTCNTRSDTGTRNTRSDTGTRSTCNTSNSTGTRNTRNTCSGGGVSHGSSRRSGRNKSAAALAEYLFG